MSRARSVLTARERDPITLQIATIAATLRISEPTLPLMGAAAAAVQLVRAVSVLTNDPQAR